MPNTISARALLRQACAIYDDPQLPFARAAAQTWRGGFASGAEWMRQILTHLRGRDVPTSPVPFQLLGVVKYGLATLGTLLFLAGVGVVGAWYLAGGLVLVFYAIEAQLVFLFPLAIDGSPDLFRTSRRWTRKAGGTVAVMIIVIQLAAMMIFGGFVGHGFVRSWALGCLAVVLWYEYLRHEAENALP